MTNISYETYYDTHIFECVGHADYSVGDDILCSALSALCYTAKRFFDKAYAAGDVKDLKCVCDKGVFLLSFRCEKNAFPRKVLGVFMEGFEMLAESFPEHISISL